MKNYLNFESDIKNLEDELDKLKDPYNQSGLSEVDTQKISQIQNELDEKLKMVYANLDPWQTTMVARHEDRPKSKFFIDNLFEDFIPLSGDRFYGEDLSVLCGFAKFNGLSVLVIGQEKGEDLDSRIKRNFGMMRPEGYRKTIRLMQLADKFNIPIISFIDTPGAYPGVGAEERGQAEAIAKPIECCMKLKVPTIAIVIGEGGSGGAIALASSNKVLMLENAIYSVISPEGCATILWRDPKKMLDAAKAMKLSSRDLLEMEIIDEIILDLFKNVSLTWLLTIRSTYRCLYLSSGELNSSYVLPSLSVFGSGRGFKDLDNNLKSLTKIVISPTLVLNNSPSIPIMSPISNSFL